MRNFTRNIFVLIIMVSITGCASTQTYIYNTGKNVTICETDNTDLGKTAVLLETAWRIDQKEPLLRQQMALEETKKAFINFPCGTIVSPDDIKKYNFSTITDEAILKNFSKQGIDSLVILRIEELTPRLEFTFSIPFLWNGSNEADFRIKVVSVKTGLIHTDMRVKRITGGPFNIRPAEWSRAELNASLRSIIKKDY